MDEDSILKELRAAREAYALAHGFEVRAMVEDLRQRDERGNWPVVKLAPRSPSTDPTRPEPDSSFTGDRTAVILIR